MALNTDTVTAVQQIAIEVDKLCSVVLDDMTKQAVFDKEWKDHYAKTGQSKWIASVSGLNARRAALRRRSLDLTRALAEMRRR